MPTDLLYPFKEKNSHDLAEFLILANSSKGFDLEITKNQLAKSAGYLIRFYGSEEVINAIIKSSENADSSFDFRFVENYCETEPKIRKRWVKKYGFHL